MLLLAIFLCFSNVQANNKINNYTSDTQEALGQAFINHLHQRYDIIQDPEINTYIRNIGNKIVQQTNSQKNFRFYVINNPSINAFAGPDGVIGIHTGLITSVANEDELASVIAHEIAHVTQEHLYRRMVMQSESTLPQIASMIAAILIGMHDTNAGMATLLSSNAYQIEQQLKYSRLHEYEADFAGINYLSLSGYDPHAMPDFFEKLAKSYQHQGMNAPEILRTHPLTENRLAKAQARAASLGNNNDINQGNDTLTLIQMRLGKIYGLYTPTLIDNNSYEKKCYSAALDDLNNKKVKIENITCLENMMTNEVKNPLYHSIYLELLTQLDPLNTDYKMKKDPLFSYELFPTNESIAIRYAELLIKQKKRDQAVRLLEKFSDSTIYKSKAESLISKTYMEMDKTAYSYFHLALAQLNTGDFRRAAIFTQKAKSALTTEENILKGKVEKLEDELDKTLKNLNDG
ncbi:MAG: M48 family metalloprotease [Thiotrichales bacterium]|nr:M48 family metalloprotease [Thiotrichales bacterium]